MHVVADLKEGFDFERTCHSFLIVSHCWLPSHGLTLLKAQGKLRKHISFLTPLTGGESYGKVDITFVAESTKDH